MLNRWEILPEDMRNKDYSVIVQPYMFGQFRIQLTKVTDPDPFAPEGHGSIVRELDTYKPETASWCMMELSEAEDPERWCIEQERDWNCEFSGDGPLHGDRIRLDNTPESNPHGKCRPQLFKPGAPQCYPIVNFRGLKR